MARSLLSHRGMQRRNALVLSLLLAGMTACVAPAVDEPAEDGSGDASSTGAGTPELPEVCGAAPTAEDPLGETVTCDGHRSDPVDPDAVPVEIEIVNLGTTAILVPDTVSGCGHDARMFWLEGMAGSRPAATPFEACADDWPACDVYLGAEGGCGACATLHPPRRIEPGGRFVTQWLPRVVVAATLPGHCIGAQAVSWGVAIAPPIGDYTASARAATTDSCPIGCAADSPVDDDGSCVAAPGGDPCAFELVASTSWDGACERIAIVFGDPR